MPTAVLTSKGQVTIPREVRRAMGVHQGDLLTFQPTDDGYLLRAPARPAIRLAGYFGPPPSKAKTLEDMELGIIAGATGSALPQASA